MHINAEQSFHMFRFPWEDKSRLFSSSGKHKSQTETIQALQSIAIRFVNSAPWYVTNNSLHKDLNVETINTISHFNHYENSTPNWYVLSIRSFPFKVDRTYPIISSSFKKKLVRNSIKSLIVIYCSRVHSLDSPDPHVRSCNVFTPLSTHLLIVHNLIIGCTFLYVLNAKKVLIQYRL